MFPMIWKSKLEVDFARAGSPRIAGNSLPAPIRISLPKLVNIEDKILVTSAYLRGVVVGNSAQQFGLSNKDFYLAAEFNSHQDIEKLEKGDVLLLRISDRTGKTNKIHEADIDFGRMKIRALDWVNIDDGTVHTITCSNGEIRHSRPHDLRDIVGLVKFKISPESRFYKRNLDSSISGLSASITSPN